MGKELINNIEESFNRVEKAYSVFLKTVGQGKIRGGKYKFRKLINGRIRYFYTEEEMNREIEKSYFGKFMGFFQFKSKKEGESKIKKDFSEAEKSITGLTIDIFRKFSLEYFANKEKIDLALNKAKKEKLKEENGSNADPKEPNSNKPKAEPTDHNDPGNKEPKPKTVNLKTKVFQFLNKKYGQPIPEESKPVEAHSPDVQSENVGSDKVENNFDTMPEVKANTPRQETVLDPPTGEVKNTIPENPKVIKAIENLKEASQPAIPEPESIGMRIEYKSFNTVKKGVVTGQKVVNGKVFYAVNFDDGTNSSLIAKEKTTIEGEDNFDTMPEVEAPKTSEETPIQAPEPMEAIGEEGKQAPVTVEKAVKNVNDLKLQKKNSIPSNTQIIIDSEIGKVLKSYIVGGETLYTIELNSGELKSNVHPDTIEILPEKNDAKIAELISNTTTETRSITNKLIQGFDPKMKQKTKVEIINIKFTPTKKEPTGTIFENFISDSGVDVVSVYDYTQHKSIDTIMLNQKDAYLYSRPQWMPDLNMDKTSFPLYDYDKENGLVYCHAKDENGRNIVAVMTTDLFSVAYEYKLHEKNNQSANRIVEHMQKWIDPKNLPKIEIGNLSPLEYIKKYDKRQYTGFSDNSFTKQYNSIKTSKLNRNKMTYRQSNYFKMLKRDSWHENEIFRKIIDNKSNDMKLNTTDTFESTYHKGKHTSYGDSELNDSLEKKLGIKVKRQNGDVITQEEISEIEKAMNDIYSIFGNKSEMAKNYGLKISFSGDKRMHASKAIGVFHPGYNAIGVSAEEDGSVKTLTLAHEFGHFMDYYLGKQKGKWFISEDTDSIAWKIADTYRDKMFNSRYANDYYNKTCECFARATEQYFSYKKTGDMDEKYSRDFYVRKETFIEEFVPMFDDFFKEYDSMLKSMIGKTYQPKQIIKSTINKLIILDNLKKLLRGKQNGEESTI